MERLEQPSLALAMGLAGGPNGAKAVFKNKFSRAFRSFDNLSEARKTVGVSRSEALVVLDGNVLMMQTPSSVDTWTGYVSVLVGQINNAIQAAGHVVVVFDEPKAMTQAKREEQKARDARRTPQTPLCSDDLVTCPTNDEFALDELQAEGLNVRLLLNHRAARPRFYDALCVAVLQHFQANLQGSNWSLTFDGIDGHGADRPLDEPRVAGIVSSHPEVWNGVLAREQPMGEGDLKLTDVCSRVYRQRVENPDSPLAKVVLNMIWTIDTDSFLIELLQQSRREARPTDSGGEQVTLLALREPARKRKGDAFPSSSFFQCIDMAMFFDEVMSYMFGSNVQLGSRAEFAIRKQHTCALLAAAVALCGCDFVQIPGLRCDLILPCVRDVARNDPAALLAMAGAFTGKAEHVRTAEVGIRAVVNNYLDSISGLGGRLTQSFNKASAFNDSQILRACWITSYWLGNEFIEVYQWGFGHAASLEHDAPAAPAASATRRQQRRIASCDATSE